MRKQSEMKPLRIPFVAKFESQTEHKLQSLGAKPLNIYKTLAHQPTLLSAWLDFAYCLRTECKTPRSMRELMILRGAQLSESQYEWQQHVPMAIKVGVGTDKIDALATWQNSGLFSEPERLALALMEALHVGEVNEELFLRITKHFSNSEYIELVLTGSFYEMVPRVLSALQVPLEDV
jgi:4-carboxymuconolactone decarboxylase